MTDLREAPKHSPEIEAILSKPGITAAEEAAMSPQERAKFEELGLLARRQPIEVWLTQANLQVTCRVISEDETATEYVVDSLSMRGAQREMTSFFIGRGYKPAGRWEAEAVDDEGTTLESVRRFR